MASFLLLAAMPLVAQTCKEAEDIDPATRSAIESAAKDYLAHVRRRQRGRTARRFDTELWRRILAESSRRFPTTKPD